MDTVRMSAGLTPMQASVLTAIAVHIERHGHSPSLPEIGMAVGLSGKGGISRHVENLVTRGHLRRMGHGNARSLSVVKVEVTPAFTAMLERMDDEGLRWLEGRISEVQWRRKIKAATNRAPLGAARP
jgi:SOS-response transcriptional repressor LexA